MSILIISLLLPIFLSAPLYDTSLYTPGTNLLVNPSFVDPAVPMGQLSIFIPLSILGWTCTADCQIKNMPLFCALKGVVCNSNITQALDLDSNNVVFENVSQTVQITTEGQYLLNLEWLPSIHNPLTPKFMTVEINSIRVLNISVAGTNFTTRF